MSSVTKTIQGTTYTIRKAPAGSGKKLAATYMNKESGREKTILFGQAGAGVYQDQTGLLSKTLIHGDPKRRASYRARHAGDRLNRPSPGQLSWSLFW